MTGASDTSVYYSETVHWYNKCIRCRIIYCWHNETFNGFAEADYTLSVLDIGSGGTHADGDIVSVSGKISGTGTQITITDSAFNASKVKLFATTTKTSVTQKNKTVQLDETG